MTNHEAITAPAGITAATPADGWFLVLDSPSMNRAPGDNTAGQPWLAHRLLGLPIVLRLALTAQAAGACAIVLAPGSERQAIQQALADERLKIGVYPTDDPMLGDRLSGAPAIRVPANVVVHRAVLGAIAGRLPAAGELVFETGVAETSTAWQTAREAAGPYGFAPIAVADRSSFDTAERALLRSLRKPQDGWTSTHLNRPISLRLTRILVGTSLRPNQVSVAILAVGLLGAFLASRGTYASLVGGAALFHAQSVLDGCDGEMSRLTFRGSHTGEWLDTIGDDLTNYGFFGGAAWGLYTSTGQIGYLALGALTVFCGLVGSGIEYRYLVKIGSGDLLKYPLGIGKAPGTGAKGAPKSALAKTLDTIAPLFKRDTFVFLTLLGAAAGAVGPLLVIFAVGAVGVLVAVIKAELRMARERAADSGDSRGGAAEPSDVKPG